MSKPFVLFDLGETLVDLRELLVSLAGRLAERYPAIRGDVADLVRRWIVDASRAMPRGPRERFVSEFTVASGVMAQVLRARGIHLTDVEAGTILREGWDDFETRVHFVHGVTEEWLKDVRSLSAGLAIVTDGDRENVNRLLRHLPLEPYFDVIVTSEDVKSYKPNASIYEAALRSLHAAPDRSIFVSDSAQDLQGAAALGMGTCLFGSQPIDRSSDLPPDSLHLLNPQDFPAALRRYASTGRLSADAR